MRVTYLCELNLVQTSDPVLVRPHGGEEGVAFGLGEGRVEGEKLRGSAQWFNFPRRRSDGAMLPDLRGVITTDDGAAILFVMEGRVVWVNTADGPVGDQLMRIIFHTDDVRYHWLNDAFCVFEGKVAPPQSRSNGRPQRIGDARVYLCVNELL